MAKIYLKKVPHIYNEKPFCLCANENGIVCYYFSYEKGCNGIDCESEDIVYIQVKPKIHLKKVRADRHMCYTEDFKFCYYYNHMTARCSYNDDCDDKVYIHVKTTWEEILCHQETKKR